MIALNKIIIDNYAKFKWQVIFIPLFFLAVIVMFVYSKGSLSADSYIDVQKGWFFYINSKLSQFPSLIYNLTQIGDTLIFFSFLSIFIIYAPKFWESLFSSSLLSLIFSNLLKNFFSIPRPAAALDNKSFVIIGDTLSAHNSLPSGHSITIFSIITVILFSFMPKKLINKFLWIISLVLIGYAFAFTRVGVGAHFPLDVIVGSLVGAISGILGILIIKKISIFSWISNKKYYPFFILSFSICCFVLINKIINEHLIIFYIALISLIISLYKITYVYFKK